MNDEKFISIKKELSNSKAFIQKRGTKFIVKNKIADKFISFGTFNNLKVARIVRDILEDNGWNAYYFDKHNIFKINETFYVFNLVDFEIKFQGTSKTYEGAVELLNERKNDFNNIKTPIKIKDNEKSIEQINGKFLVKHNSNILGEFISLDIARLVRNILSANRWNVNYFKENSIVQLDNSFAIFEVKFNKVRYINSFSIYEDAVAFLDKNRLENWKNSEKTITVKSESKIKEKEIISEKFKIEGYKKPFISFDNGYFIVKDDSNILGKFKQKREAKDFQKILDDYKNDSSYFQNDRIVNKKGKFYVFQSIDDEPYFLGIFNSEDEAKVKLGLDFKDNKTISTDVFDEDLDKYGPNIKLIDKLFTVMDNTTVFGRFSSLEIATFVRDTLIDNNWDMGFFINNNIFHVDGKFQVFEVVSNEIKLVGSYLVRDYAQKIANQNKDKKKMPANKQSPYGTNVYKISGEFVIQKSFKNKAKVFGKFSSNEDALFVRNILDENNWKTTYFKSNPILEINNKFGVFKVVNDNIQLVDKFSSREEAEKSFYEGIFNEKIPKNTVKQNSSKESKYGKHISFNNGKYYISKSFKGRIKQFGNFRSHEVALLVRDKLMENKWDVNYFKGNILENNNEFLVFNVENKKIVLSGMFDELEDAKIFIGEPLVEKENTDSQINYKKTSKTSKYGTFIYRVGDVFRVEKKIKNKARVFGKFKSHEVAILVRDTLVENNWNINVFGNNAILQKDGKTFNFKIKDKMVHFIDEDEVKKIKSVNESKIESGKHISHNNGKYYLSKSIKGKVYNFGNFEDYGVALFVRDKLVENNWNRACFKNKIFEIDNKWCSFKIDNNKVVLLGKFESYEEANNSLDELIKVSSSSQKESKYGKYISYGSGKYYINKYINGESSGYGKFLKHDVALFVRDKLVENDWNVDYFKKNPIAQINNAYCAFRVVKGKIECIGLTDTYLAAENLLNESSNSQKGSKYGTNIYLIKNRFMIQKSIKNRNKKFGGFESNEDAIFVRDILNENNWSINYFKSNPILKMGDDFGLFKVVDNEIELVDKFKSYMDAEIAKNNGNDPFIESEFIVKNNEKVYARLSNLESARIIRDKLVENEWDINYFKYNNIFELNDKYYAFQLKEDKLKLQGIFNSYENAVMELYGKKIEKYEDILILPSNYKNFNYVDVIEMFEEILEINDNDIDIFKTQNIFQNGRKFYIFKLKGDKVKFLERADSIDEAKDKLKEYNKTTFNKEDSSNNLEFILKRNDGYDIIKPFNGKFTTYGKFPTEEVALFVRDILKEMDWNVDYFNNNNLFQISGDYYVFRSFDDKINFIGKFKSKEDAENALDNFLNEKYPLKKDVKTDKNVELSYNGRKFRISCNNQEVASFTTKYVAILFKRIFVNNNCNINYFKDNNIHQIDTHYSIYKLVKDEIRFLGEFDNKKDAEEKLKRFEDSLKQNESSKTFVQSPIVSKDKVFDENNLSKISLNVSKFKDKFVVSYKNQIWGRFNSKSIADVFINLVKMHGIDDKKFFQKNSVFTYNLNFYIFKLINNEVKFLNTFEFYSRVQDWINNYNKGIISDQDKINSVLIEKPQRSANSISFSKFNDKEENNKSSLKNITKNDFSLNDVKFNGEDKYVLLDKEEIIGKFSSYYDLKLFKILFKNVDENIEFFDKNNVFKIGIDFFIFKLIDGSVRFLKKFEFYSDVIKWVKKFNSLKNHKINLDIVDMPGISNKISDILIDDEGEGIYLSSISQLSKTKDYNIFKQDNAYYLIRNMKIYGEYYSFYDAEVVRKFLSLYDWDLRKLNDSGKIFGLDNNYYVLSKNKGLVTILGKFDSYGDAADIIEKPDIYNNIN